MNRLTRFTQEVVRHAPVVLIGFAVVFAGSVPLAVAWFAASRLTYMLYAGLSLRAEARHRAFSRRDGPEAAWKRFSTRVGWLMDNDAVAFMALCLVTGGTLVVPVPGWVTFAVGAALAVVGIGIKAWASANLPDGSYHWRNFFVEDKGFVFSASGPYRWLSHPMYTLGYAHTYGLALALRSVHGLVGAAFAQTAILILNHVVERPHFGEIKARFGESAPGAAPGPVVEPADPRRQSEAARGGGSK